MAEAKLSDWHNPGKSWFLGIGINKYIEFTNLSNAVGDVQKIQSILEQTYDLSDECIHTLFDENANEEAIIDKLDFLSKQVGPDDKLIIYYSGHGMVNHDIDVGYWIPHDAKKTSSARYILNSTIKDYIGGLDAKHILLISDSCFSGSMFMRGASRSTNVSDELADLPSRWAICSGRNDEEVYDGDPGSHSPFAQSLINYLESIKSESINVGRVVNHVIEETAANYEQLPDGRPMFGVGHGGGQYIFRKKGTYAAPPSTGKKEAKKDKAATRRTESQLGQGTSSKSNNQPITDKDIKMFKIVGLSILGVFLIVALMFWGISNMGGDGELVDDETTLYLDHGKVDPFELEFENYFAPEAYHRITNDWLGEEKSLDILNDGLNKTPLLTETGNLSGQAWFLIEIGGGYYRMTTEFTGENRSLAYVQSSGEVRLEDSQNVPTQYWKFHHIENNLYRITNFQLGEDWSLDVVNDEYKENLMMAESSQASGQYWLVTED